MTSPTYGDPTQLAPRALTRAVQRTHDRIATGQTGNELDTACNDWIVLRAEVRRRAGPGVVLHRWMESYPTLVRPEDGHPTTVGGVPVYYLCADGGVLCAECANGPDATRTLDPECPDDDQWRIIARELNNYTNMTCDHCAAVLLARVS